MLNDTQHITSFINLHLTIKQTVLLQKTNKSGKKMQI